MTAMQISIEHIPFGSDVYHQTRDIREKYLRLPLGLNFSEDDLNLDRQAHHLIAYKNNQTIGCVLGVQEQNKVKIRQMLVIPEYRNKGVGSRLLNQMELFFASLGIGHFYLHSRQESVGFYLKNGYSQTGNTFLEIGIIHQRMEKFLSSQLCN